MQTDSRTDRWLARATGGLVVAALAGAGLALAGLAGALAGTGAGTGVAFGLARLLTRRSRRRRDLLARPWRRAWRRALRRHSAHYRRLPPALRARFETDVRLFLAETRITGVEAPLSDELRLLVAASAVTLSVGWPAFEWDRLTEVLLYPQPFDRDYGFASGRYAGMAHPSGEVILSIPSLRRSFAEPPDGHHTGYHEFAHLLDLEVGPSGMQFDGLPTGVAGAAAVAWEQLARREMERVRRGTSVLDAYAATNAVEFFAVAVETFFERPVELRARHPELYGALAAYFRQDPAGWDRGDATGEARAAPRRSRSAPEGAEYLEGLPAGVAIAAIGAGGLYLSRSLGGLFRAWMLALLGLGVVVALAILGAREWRAWRTLGRPRRRR